LNFGKELTLDAVVAFVSGQHQHMVDSPPPKQTHDGSWSVELDARTTPDLHHVATFLRICDSMSIARHYMQPQLHHMPCRTFSGGFAMWDQDKEPKHEEPCETNEVANETNDDDDDDDDKQENYGLTYGGF
jgi:hypothetical protein